MTQAKNCMHEGKSLNNRNFILKLTVKYAQRKILFRDTKRLLSNMPHTGRDDRAVWACAIARTTWSLHCQLAPWKRCAYSGHTTCSEIWGVETCTIQSRTWRHRTFTSPVKEHSWDQKFADDNEVMEAVESWFKTMPKAFFFFRGQL